MTRKDPLRPKAKDFTTSDRAATIAGMRKLFPYVAVMGSCAFAYDDKTKDDVEFDLRHKAKRSGEMIEWPDGTTEFYHLGSVFNGTGEHGGYIWKGGDKVKARLTKHVQSPKGRHEQEVIWEGFVKFDRLEVR